MIRLPLAFDRERSLPEQVGEWLNKAAPTLACLPATDPAPSRCPQHLARLSLRP